MSGNLRGRRGLICIPILHRYQPFIMYCIIKHLTTQLYCIRQMMDLWLHRLKCSKDAYQLYSHGLLMRRTRVCSIRHLNLTLMNSRVLGK